MPRTFFRTLGSMGVCENNQTFWWFFVNLLKWCWMSFGWSYRVKLYDIKDEMMIPWREFECSPIFGDKQNNNYLYFKTLLDNEHVILRCWYITFVSFCKFTETILKVIWLKLPVVKLSNVQTISLNCLISMRNNIPGRRKIIFFCLGGKPKQPDCFTKSAHFSDLLKNECVILL